MAKKTKSSTSYGVQALERALYLMEMIKEKGGADANYLAKELGVHRSSVYRILGALQRWGYVRQDSQNMKFQLGLKFIEMANQVDFFHELRLLAIPYMEKLMQHTRETTHLMTLENDHVFYLAKVESPETIRMFSRVGVRRPAYCTAGGEGPAGFSAAPGAQAVGGKYDPGAAHGEYHPGPGKTAAAFGGGCPAGAGPLK